MTTKKEWLEEAENRRSEYEDLADALGAAAEDLLTSRDCKLYHQAKLSPSIRGLVAAFHAVGEDGFQLWGGVDDREPITIIPHV